MFFFLYILASEVPGALQTRQLPVYKALMRPSLLHCWNGLRRPTLGVSEAIPQSRFSGRSETALAQICSSHTKVERSDHLDALPTVANGPDPLNYVLFHT